MIITWIKGANDTRVAKDEIGRIFTEDKAAKRSERYSVTMLHKGRVIEATGATLSECCENFTVAVYA